jgi:ribulose-5-phosphate 4-epimerase/fuculose-1-phosphate aldolase
MIELQRAIRELVIANRILAKEEVVDAYGHVSIRHPQRPEHYLLSCSRSPELVTPEDIMEFTLESEAVGSDRRSPYLERFIHGAIYESRPDINAVVHAHAEDVLPFTITATPLRPVIHSGSVIGAPVPVWDIADKFGDGTNLLVTTLAQGRDLAQRLGKGRVALMRGHGFAAAGRNLLEVLRIAIYLPRNARVQQAAMRMGGYKPLSEGEIAARTAIFQPGSSEVMRAWEYWARRSGCSELLEDDGAGEPVRK